MCCVALCECRQGGWNVYGFVCRLGVCVCRVDVKGLGFMGCWVFQLVDSELIGFICVGLCV